MEKSITLALDPMAIHQASSLKSFIEGEFPKVRAQLFVSPFLQFSPTYLTLTSRDSSDILEAANLFGIAVDVSDLEQVH